MRKNRPTTESIKPGYTIVRIDMNEEPLTVEDIQQLFFTLNEEGCVWIHGVKKGTVFESIGKFKKYLNGVQ